MAQNIQLFRPREGFPTHQWLITRNKQITDKYYDEAKTRTRQKRVETDTWRSLGCRTTPLEHWSKIKPTAEPRHWKLPSRTPRHWKLPSTIAQPNHPLLNKQLQSVFTCLSPLRLGQHCSQTIQKLFCNNLPDDPTSSCPSMSEINIDLNGVLKLLSKLNQGKAAGQNSIKYKIRNEIL